MFDIICAGHFAIDSIQLPNRLRPFVVLGGPPAYVLLSARKLDARVSVISKVGRDFPSAYFWLLREEGVDVEWIKKVEDALTTRFELSYGNDLEVRSLRLTAKGPKISFFDIPESAKAKVIHVAPIDGEIDYDTIKALKAHCEILSLDPQGFLRNFSPAGDVEMISLEDKRVLEFVDIYKSSKEEIQTLTEQPNVETAISSVHDSGISVVIVTLGSQGSLVSIDNKLHSVPAFRPESFVDPTGAGDVYIGAFLAEYVRGEDCAWCACVGSAAASTVVEGIGPTHFGSKDEILRRAHQLYEKEIKS